MARYFLHGLIVSAFFLLGPAAVKGEVWQETLPNGLDVVIWENHHSTTVSLDLWIKTGSRMEPPGKNGIAHLLEHLLFQGTARRSAQGISREVAAVGGQMNGFTFWEYTRLNIYLLAPHLNLGLDILADMAQNSIISQKMLEKERRVVLEEISLANIYPPSYILNLVSKTLFPGNPLAVPITGTKETVLSLDRSDLLQFYRRHYSPQNALLTLVGRVDPPAAREEIWRKFGFWTRGAPAAPVLSPPPAQDGARTVKKRQFLDQAIVVLALPTIGLKDRDRPVLEIINTILGSGGNSRLYQEVREKRALSYLVGSMYYPISDMGLWAAYAGAHPNNAGTVQEIIRREVQRLQQKPLPPGELDQAKNFIRGRTAIRHEKNSSLAEFIGPRLIAGSRETPEEFLEKVQAVTPEDIQRVARTYINEARFNWIILKPYPGLMLLRNLL